jgi:uncharacterized protein (TIGR02266 family)
MARLLLIDGPVRTAARSGRADVEVEVLASTGRESFVGVSRNVGAGGLFLATDRTLTVGDHLTLRFELPELRLPISTQAEVRWVREDRTRASGVGLQFVKPSIATRAAVLEFVRAADPDLTPSAGNAP